MNNSFLDLVDHNMDFEQAYTMYNSLQQKNALVSMEQLQLAQQGNGQAMNGDFRDYEYSRMEIMNGMNGIGHISSDLGDVNSHQINQINHEVVDSMNVASIDTHIHPAHTMNHGRSQGHGHGQAQAHGQVGNQSGQGHESTLNPSSLNPPEEKFSDFDQFFSNTESDALERFLDNLTNPSGSTNPMNLYNTEKSSKPVHFDTMFDLHTMKTFKSNDHESLKKELNEAFSYPIENFSKEQDVQPLENYSSSSSSPNFQLPTPNDSRQISSSNIMYNYKNDQLNSPPEDKKRIMMDDDEFSPKRRRRSSNKHLLTLEQKRLNHSHSEQKRRQLCKLAYERCLKLIINIELFNKLPNNLLNKKSKRAKLNKEGLPNLSKHSALIRISSEIMLIYNKNQELKKLIKEHNYRG